MATLPASSSSRSLRPSARRNRGPLQELPLDHFLQPPTMSNTASKLGMSTKRPVSPGTPVIYSPAKRRILNEEGLFSAKSPISATAMSSAAPSSSKQPATAPQYPHQQYQQSNARFADAFRGPDSPARKLDFGMPKNAAGSKTPSRHRGEEKLASSPEIKATSRSRLRKRGADEDYFSIPAQAQPSQPQLQSTSQTILSPSSSGSSSQPNHHLDFLYAPREPPSSIDPQSEHYPGFDVYQDPHILIPTLRLTSPPPSSSTGSALVPLDGNVDDESDVEPFGSREFVKENLPPRRKIRKASTSPIPEKVQLFSPPSAKSSSAPATPPRETLLRERDILTPRRHAIFGVGIGSGIDKAHHMPSKEERHAMRRILEEEVDHEGED